MLADHTTLHVVAEWVPLAALGVLTIGWLAGNFQRGRSDASHEAIAIASEEIEVLKSARDRLRADLDETKVRLSDAMASVAKLEGIVDGLRAENAELRKLISLEKVPPALLDSLRSSSETVMETVMGEVETMHERQVDQLTSAFGEQAREMRDALVAHFDRMSEQNRLYWNEMVGDRLHAVEQGIARLLTEGGETDA